MLSKNKFLKFTDTNFVPICLDFCWYFWLSVVTQKHRLPLQSSSSSLDVSSIFCNQHHYFGFFLLTFLLGHHLLEQLHIWCEVDRPLFLYLGASSGENFMSGLSKDLRWAWSQGGVPAPEPLLVLPATLGQILFLEVIISNNEIFKNS